MQSVQTRNTLNDFKVLSKASEALQDKLRSDDANPDLINEFSDSIGCHKYYIEPYRQDGSLLEHAEFFAFPKRILDLYNRIECASFMGILPEIDRVWITIDNHLYLWNYANQHEFEVYEGLSEVIVSVALCAPKPNVFLDTVKYVLVVATSVEVVVLAITFDSKTNRMKLSPTAYKEPSDNVTMFKIVGSQKGRIFMAGNDGNLYELDYSNADNSWASYVGMGSSSHKCRKINHFAYNFQMKHLIPPFIRTPLFGDEDSLFDVAVDDMRNTMYCVTTGGRLSAIYLGANGKSASFITTSFNILQEAKDFLERHRCESSPRAESFSSSSSSPGFNIIGISIVPLTESKEVHVVVILGNAIRLYLSLHTDRGFFSRVPLDGADQLQKGGDGYLAYPGSDRSAAPPTSVRITYVLSPPPRVAVQNSTHDPSRGAAVSALPADGAQDIAANGCKPSFDRAHALEIGCALYTKGVVLLASEPRDPAAPPGSVLGLYEDIVSRSRTGGASAAAGSVEGSARVGGARGTSGDYMREGLSTVLGGDKIGSKVYDMKERCTTSMRFETTSQVAALYFQSLTPGDTHLKDNSFHRLPPMKQKDKNGAELIPSSEFPVTLCGTNCLAPAGRKRGTGYSEFDRDSVAPLNEFCHQHIPSGSVSLQRQFLVLTNQGIHLLRKIRPIDILHRDLMLFDQQIDRMRSFFWRYGALQSSAMCVALSCGLPADAGTGLIGRGVTGLPGLDRVVSNGGGVGMGAVTSAATLQSRAMSVVMNLSDGPTYKSVADLAGVTITTAAAGSTGPGAGAMAVHAGTTSSDSRLVLSGGGEPEFFRSTVHDALYITASRILRPIWLRAITCAVPDGSGPRTKDVLDSMWSRDLLHQLAQPLHRLADIMRGYFPLAVQMDITQSQLSDFTVSFSPHSNLEHHAEGRTAAEQQNRRLLEQKARGQEQISLCLLYRLITRSLHTIALLDILIGVRDDWCIPITWNQLRNISFRALVTSSACHGKVKKLLNALINQISSSDKLAVSERLIERLSDEAFHFFSAGDRSEYEATRELEDMKTAITTRAGGTGGLGSKFFADLRQDQAHIVSLLLGAGKYWKSLEAVIADPDGNGSTALTRTCATMMSLGESGRKGIVDICLTVAENFLGPLGLIVDSKRGIGGPNKEITLRLTNVMGGFGSGSAAGAGQLVVGVSGDGTLDKYLYHGGGQFTAQESHGAIQACCQCLVDNIMAVGAGSALSTRGIGDGVTGTGESLYDQYSSSSGGAGDDAAAAAVAAGEDPVRARAQAQMHAMIVHVVTHCEGRGSSGNGALTAMADMFLEALFTKLLNDQQDQLLAIRSQSVAAFLSEKDTDLLYKYYGLHSEFVQASSLMSSLAREDRDMEISERIQCFVKAIASGECVLASIASGSIGTNSSISSTLLTMNPPSAGVFSEYLLGLKDLLEVAEYQQSAYTTLANYYQERKEQLARTGGGSAASQAEQDSLRRTVHSLRYKLVDISQLFGVVCLPYKLWELCIKLLHASNSEDPELTARLWRSLIYRQVPEEARSGESRQFLRAQRTPVRMDFDKRYQTGGMFEDSELWLPSLGTSIVSLATSLKGSGIGAVGAASGTSSAFPVLVVLEELEDIASTLWSARATNSSSGVGAGTNASPLSRGASSSTTATHNIFGQSWTVDRFLEIGLSHGSLMETYMELIEKKWSGKAAEKLLRLVGSASVLLMRWTHAAQSHNSSSSNARMQLLQADRSGRLREWLDALDRRRGSAGASLTSGGPEVSMLLNVITEELHEIRRRVMSITSM